MTFTNALPNLLYLYVFLAGILLIPTAYYLTNRRRTSRTSGTVLSVAVSTDHSFSKLPVASITLIAGLGVEGDCHLGTTVQHRSRLHIRPPPPNLRQVHLIQNEILQQYGVKPAEIGENLTTIGIDLLALGRGTKLHFIPADADISTAEQHPVVQVTGLRNPCPQIEEFKEGLQEKFIVRDAERKIMVRKAGIMSIVEVGGKITPGMKIFVKAPINHEALDCV